MSVDKGIAVEVGWACPPTGSAAAGQSQQLSRTGLLHLLFQTLEEEGIRYCVLHSYEDLAEQLPGDLDLAVHPEDLEKIPIVFQSLREHGYRPVQCLTYAVRGHYFVFFWHEQKLLQSLAIDIIDEHRRSGLIFASGEWLVSRRRKLGEFWIPDPSTEFTYLLVKKSLKGAVPVRQERRLRQLVYELGQEQATQAAEDLFGKRRAGLVVQACTNRSIAESIGDWKRWIWLTTLKSKPLNPARYFFGDIFRIILRWMQPTGLFVCVLGPDGVGKSTLIEHLIRSVGTAFRRQQTFHWRPGVLARKLTGPVTNPHGQAPHPAWVSIVHLFGRLLDYWLGYCFVVRPLLARSGFVVFDRYFHDLLVDPIRYRYGGPQWLPRVLVRLLPQPDLMLILDAPEHVILSRKQEVAREEVVRQRLAYLKASDDSFRAVVLDASLPMSEVGEKAAKEIASFLERRFRHRHPSWLRTQEIQDCESAERGNYRHSQENVIQKVLELLSKRHFDQNRLSINDSPSLPVMEAPSGNAGSRPQPTQARSSRTALGAHRFAVLPSRRSPRWLIPLGDRQRSLRGFELWLPYSRSGRLAKHLFTSLIRLGLLDRASKKAEDWSQGPLPIESFISDVTGEKEPVFALSLGTPGPYYKLTIRVMRRTGECLGYIKLPLTEAATARVRHEAEVLAQLWQFPAMRPFIPRLLHAGAWADTYLLFQSSAPGGRGPIGFGPIHHQFLKTLWDVHPSKKAGHQLVLEVATRWQKFAHRMSSDWQDLGARALEKAGNELAGSSIPCGIAHSDFAPWNTRMGDGRLFVFDWESAAWDVPQRWDFYHFRTQVASLLHRVGRSMNSWEPPSHSMDPSHEVALHMLYTLKSVSNLIEEGAPERSPALKYRRRLLVGMLAARRSTRRSVNVL